jgi:hypothetical protein
LEHRRSAPAHSQQRRIHADICAGNRNAAGQGSKQATNKAREKQRFRRKNGIFWLKMGRN